MPLFFVFLFQTDSQPVVHVIASRSQDWSEHEIAVDTNPTIIYQDVSSESQSATSTIKALLELQQTTGLKLFRITSEVNFCLSRLLY